MIFTPSGTDLQFYQEMNDVGMPLVAVSRQPASLKVDSVVVANRDGSKQAVAHLAQLGHSRIAMISGPASVSTAKERLRGYEQALRAAGIPVSAELVQYADFRQAGGYRAMQNLLALSDRPTAVFAGSNLMTLGALQAIHEAGLRIPDELAIIGFDDMPWAVSLQPPLTVVAQPAFDVGVAAARLLLERIAKPSAAPKQITLDTRLVIRASSGERVTRRAYAQTRV
jgi:DNA-binding LacI/PurR family transcriptional regulator